MGRELLSARMVDVFVQNLSCWDTATAKNTFENFWGSEGATGARINHEPRLVKCDQVVVEVLKLP